MATPGLTPDPARPGGGGDRPTDRPRCVVWSLTDERPGPLLSSLNSRGVLARVVREPPDVLVALAQSPHQLAILQGPGDVRQAARLVRAVRRYHERVIVSAYRTTEPAGHRLVSLMEADDIESALVQAWRAAPDPVTAAEQTSDPPRDVVDDERVESAEPSAAVAASQPAGFGFWDEAAASVAAGRAPASLLTPDEIEVLLGPADDEEVY